MWDDRLHWACEKSPYPKKNEGWKALLGIRVNLFEEPIRRKKFRITFLIHICSPHMSCWKTGQWTAQWQWFLFVCSRLLLLFFSHSNWKFSALGEPDWTEVQINKEKARVTANMEHYQDVIVWIWISFTDTDVWILGLHLVELTNFRSCVRPCWRKHVSGGWIWAFKAKWHSHSSSLLPACSSKSIFLASSSGHQAFLPWQVLTYHSGSRSQKDPSFYRWLWTWYFIIVIKMQWILTVPMS